MLYYVLMHHACYGVETKGGIVVAAPPIVDWWIIGKSIEVLIDMVERRGGTVEAISDGVCPFCGFPYHPSAHTEDEPCPEVFWAIVGR